MDDVILKKLKQKIQDAVSNKDEIKQLTQLLSDMLMIQSHLL